MSFFNDFDTEVFNCNSNTQVDLSCGYICASIATYTYQLQNFSSAFLTRGQHGCYKPDIMAYNSILSIHDKDAQILESAQIMQLVSCLTGDCNLEWLFTLDINMFKSFVKSDFSNLHLPRKGDKRWGVFCVNDAVLTSDQRKHSFVSKQYNGSHWYTVVLITE